MGNRGQLMRLGDLLRGLDQAIIHGNPDTEISGVRYDSRRVTPGDLFVAMPGQKADGHQFLDEAIRRGAAALLVKKDKLPIPKAGVTVTEVPDTRKALAIASNIFYGFPSRSMVLIGITGTNGKTTSSYLIKGILEAAGKRVGLIGTISYQMGGEQIPAPHTTPESADLQEILAKMRDRGLEYVVMEVSSHALEQDRVFGTVFDIALFTNLTQDHLDFHTTMEEYFRAKLRLFQDLKPKGTIKIRGVINLDDKWGKQIIGEMKFPCLSYSLTDKGDIIARECLSGSDGASFTAVTPVGKFSIKSKLAGRHNLQNILASIGVACALDIPIKAIQDGISGVENVPGRLEKVSEGQDFEVFVDYAHTEDALRNLLSLAKEISRGKIITVFGCGGDRDRGKRPKMGKVARDMSDIMIITSDNPRGEDPLAIIEEIETGISGLKRGTDYFVVEDRRSAIEMAVNLAMPGDTVILAGKGHEDYQIIGGKRLHFDDREVARKIIRERPSRQRGKP